MEVFLFEVALLQGVLECGEGGGGGGGRGRAEGPVRVRRRAIGECCGGGGAGRTRLQHGGRVPGGRLPLPVAQPAVRGGVAARLRAAAALV